MKKLFLLFTFLMLFSISTFSQKVYCEIVGHSKMFSSKVSISIDYGQETSYFSMPEKLVDKNGKKIEFNSMVDALNYMSELGWELETTYAISHGQNYQVYHFLLSKTIGKQESAEDGITTNKTYKRKIQFPSSNIIEKTETEKAELDSLLNIKY